MPDTIRLDHFLKLKGLVRSGGEAKHRIQGGEVTLNGAVETRRSRKLAPGDRVALGGEEHVVEGTPAALPEAGVEPARASARRSGPGEEETTAS